MSIVEELVARGVYEFAAGDRLREHAFFGPDEYVVEYDILSVDVRNKRATFKMEVQPGYKGQLYVGQNVYDTFDWATLRFFERVSSVQRIRDWLAIGDVVDVKGLPGKTGVVRAAVTEASNGQRYRFLTEDSADYILHYSDWLERFPITWVKV